MNDGQSIQANGSPTGVGEPDVRIVGEFSEDVINDDHGRIFRFDGTLISRPGLEPENIRRGLEDIAAGRVTSLEELRARRS